MTARTCNLCEWWVSAAADAAFGTCRAHPPTVDQGAAVWPSTASDEWCGAFRIGERLLGGRDCRVAQTTQEAVHGA